MKNKKMSNQQKRKYREIIRKRLELEDCNQQQEWRIYYLKGIINHQIGKDKQEKKALAVACLEKQRDLSIEQQTLIQNLLKQIQNL
jgi:hypothetical protein